MIKAPDDSRHGDLLRFVSEIDEAYRLKAKRLRFMAAASQMREVAELKRRFDCLWRSDNGRYFYSEPQPTDRGLAVLTGIFGYHEEIERIQQINSAIITLDKGLFLRFLQESVASEAAVRHLYGIFFATGSLSIEQMAMLENRYLERYIPIFRLFDRMGLRELRVREEEMVTIREIVDNYGDITDTLADDLRLHRAFARDFWRLYREPAQLSIIGYGEISTVMQISSGVKAATPWIWKKMPPFPSLQEVLEYVRVYGEYRSILVQEIGLTVPEQGVSYFNHGSFFTVYAGQERQNPAGLCHRLIRGMDGQEAAKLFRRLLAEIRKVHAYNRRGGRILVGLDCQLSNWVIESDRHGPLIERGTLTYIDTSSPLYRIEGREQLNTELLIKNAPSFLRAIIKVFFLKDVVDRYYDTRSVIIDLIATLHKEQRPDLIDGLLAEANDSMAAQGMGGKPITRKEIDAYYSQDAFIWRFFQFSRRVDRFIIESILRRRYAYRLPGRVAR
ncbi:MAG: hypothetical protein JXA20_12140 [Spirochaetes bacterium]|nr:hypothetical protein [Spirochaetota bacterium]